MPGSESKRTHHCLKEDTCFERGGKKTTGNECQGGDGSEGGKAPGGRIVSAAKKKPRKGPGEDGAARHTTEERTRKPVKGGGSGRHMRGGKTKEAPLH